MAHQDPQRHGSDRTTDDQSRAATQDSSSARTAERRDDSGARGRATPHPVRAVGGALGGAAVGALTGAAAGPLGAAAGAVGGAAVGAASGVEPGVMPREEQAPSEHTASLTDAQRREAVRYGREARRRLGKGAQWSDAEPSLKAGWASAPTGVNVSWEQATDAVREGWETPDAARGE